MSYQDAFLDEYRKRNDPEEALWAFEAIVASKCESPIEKMMAAHLVFINPGWHQTGFENLLYDEDALGEDRIALIPQHQVGRYRLDFAVIATCPVPGRRLIRVAVECDGHDFHEKTKEQAARDKKRDRDLARAGWIVLRFTGSEIYRDAAGCARQVSDCIGAAIEEAIDWHLKGDRKDGG